MDKDKASLCSWPSNTSAASAWKRWSHERLNPRDVAWSGEVRPKKKPWSLSGYDALGPPSVANRRCLPLAPVRPVSLSPVKQQYRIAKSKSISPQSLRPSRKAFDGEQIGIAQLRDPSVSLPPSRAEEGTGRVPLLWRSFLLQAADPDGDCSWGLPYQKTYELLPELILNSGDWGSFTFIMCDLMFLWRKLQCNNAMELIQLYDQAAVALSAKGARGQGLQACLGEFQKFLDQNMSALSHNPNCLFRLASLSRHAHVKTALRERQNKAQRFLDEMNQLLSVQKSPAQQQNATTRETDKSGSNTDEQGRLDQTLLLFGALQKAKAMQRCGLVGSLSEEAKSQFAVLFRRLGQQLESNRGLMREQYSAYQDMMVSCLPADSYPDRKATHKFLELAGIWTDVESGAWLSLTVWDGRGEWGTEIQKSICQQVAEAACVDVQLVDLISIARDPRQQSQGNALLRLMAHMPGLEVEILSGNFWPILHDMCELTVGVKVASLRSREGVGSTGSTGSNDKITEVNFQANHARSVQHMTQAKAAPGETDSANPRFQNEKFELLLYQPRQCVVITAYSLFNGIRSIVGEFTVALDDMLSECRRSVDLCISRSFPMFNPSTHKPVYNQKHADTSRLKQAEMRVSFRFFAKTALRSPQEMVKRVCKQAIAPVSSLRAGCIITGLPFPLSTSWDTITLYIASNDIDMRNEREFLRTFVLPSIQLKCLSLNIQFRWVDMLCYGNGSTQDDVVKRLSAIKSSRIRGHDATGQERNVNFVLCLLGERRGRLLDSRDRKKLMAVNKNGEYDRLLQAENEITVLEMELTEALLHSGHSEAIVAIRNPAFLDNKEFVQAVPKNIRAQYMEPYRGMPDSDGKTNSARTMNELKEAAMAKASRVIQYHAHFEKFVLREDLGEGDRESLGEGATRAVTESRIRPASQILKRRNALGRDSVLETMGEVRLGGMHALGLSVFEAVFDVVSKRYPYCRSSAKADPYHETLSRQQEIVRSYCACQLQVPDGSQENVLRCLDEFYDFIQLEHGDLVLLLGPHGCGKTTLLCRFLSDLKVVKPPEKGDQHQNYSSQAAFKSLMIVNRLGQKLRGDGNGTQMSHNEWTELRARAHEMAAQQRISPSDIVSNLEVLEPRYRIRLEKTIAGLHAQQDRHMSPHEIKFRCREPEIHFYFKEPGDKTSDKMLAHLCSSLLHSYARGSWTMLEKLLTELSSPQASPQSSPSPVLLVLDGLDHEERYQFRRIILSLQGRVRAVISVDEALLRKEDQSSHAGLRGLSDKIIMPPLAYDERKIILRCLLAEVFKRLASDEKDSLADALAQRPAAGSPLYLQAVIAYLKAAEVLRIIPESHDAIGTDTLDIIMRNFIPMVENRFGTLLVRWCFEILMTNPRGFSSKEFRALLTALASSEPGCNINDMDDRTIELLIESFRPFADTHARMRDDELLSSRACMREAFSLYYHQGDLEAKAQADFNSSLALMQQFADEQDARLKQLMRLGTSHCDSGGNDWFSSDEEDQFSATIHADTIVDEINLRFGKHTRMFSRALFLKWCSTLELEGGRVVVYQMDLMQLLKFLRHQGIFPDFATKKHIVRAFEKAMNLNKVGKDSSAVEGEAMDFHAWLQCMRILQHKYKSFSDVEYTRNQYDAACVLQAHHRGNWTRIRCKRLHFETIAEKAGSYDRQKIEKKYSNAISLIIKCQAKSRAFLARVRLKKKLQREDAARNHGDVNPVGATRIKGRLRKDGPMAVLQQRLMMVFDNVQDAFVFIDIDGNDHITMQEFSIGLRRLLTTEDAQAAAEFAKCGAAIASRDKSIDIFGFMRAVSWHDVRNAKEAVSEAKMFKSSIVAKAKERLQSFADKEAKALKAEPEAIRTSPSKRTGPLSFF